MVDISTGLHELMRNGHCTSFYVFYLLGGMRDEPNELSVSEPVPKTAKQYNMGTGHRRSKGIQPDSKRERSPDGQRDR